MRLDFHGQVSAHVVARRETEVAGAGDAVAIFCIGMIDTLMKDPGFAVAGQSFLPFGEPLPCCGVGVGFPFQLLSSPKVFASVMRGAFQKPLGFCSVGFSLFTPLLFLVLLYVDFTDELGEHG